MKIRIDKNTKDVLLWQNLLNKIHVRNTLITGTPYRAYVLDLASTLINPSFSSKIREMGFKGKMFPNLYDLITSLLPFINRIPSDVFRKNFYKEYLSFTEGTYIRTAVSYIDEHVKNNFYKVEDFCRWVYYYYDLYYPAKPSSPALIPYYNNFMFIKYNPTIRYANCRDISSVVSVKEGQKDIFRMIYLKEISEAVGVELDPANTLIFSMSLPIYLHMLEFDGENIPSWVPKEIREEFLRDINTRIQDLLTTSYGSKFINDFYRLLKKYTINVISTGNKCITAVTKLDTDITKNEKMVPVDVYFIDLPTDLIVYEIVQFMGYRNFLLDIYAGDIIDINFIPATFIMGPCSFILTRGFELNSEGLPYKPYRAASIVSKLARRWWLEGKDVPEYTKKVKPYLRETLTGWFINK